MPPHRDFNGQIQPVLFVFKSFFPFIFQLNCFSCVCPVRFMLEYWGEVGGMKKKNEAVLMFLSHLINNAINDSSFFFSFFSDASLCDHLCLLIKKPLLQIRGPQRPLSRWVSYSSARAPQPDGPTLVIIIASITTNSHWLTARLFVWHLNLSFSAASESNYDHVVEEHFQRSLGVNYQRARSQQLSISVSVDDHFAKALGDKWLQIKSKSSSCSSTPPSSPSVTHSPAHSHSPNQSHKESAGSSSPTSSRWSVK